MLKRSEVESDPQKHDCRQLTVVTKIAFDAADVVVTQQGRDFWLQTIALEPRTSRISRERLGTTLDSKYVLICQCNARVSLLRHRGPQSPMVLPMQEPSTDCSFARILRSWGRECRGWRGDRWRAHSEQTRGMHRALS